MGVVLCRGYWRISSSHTPRTLADNQRMVCHVFRYRRLPSPRIATEKIQRCRCFSARAVFRCTADFDCRAHLGRLRAAPALLVVMNAQLFVSARAAIDHHRVDGCVEHSTVKRPNQGMKRIATDQNSLSVIRHVHSESASLLLAVRLSLSR